MPATVLAGLIGTGIQKSLTPTMHEREGAALGIPYIYKLIDLDALGLPASTLAELVDCRGEDGLQRPQHNLSLRTGRIASA